MEQKKRARWRKLDNAALLFSAVNTKKDTRVFRFYCELNEPVKQQCLQTALLRAVEVYPLFLSVMRKGLFWHYLEHSDLVPVVREEYREPCSYLYVRDKKTLLFEVTYYRNRINFEVFHALTDGTGATEFLRELVKQYLLIIDETLPDIVLGDATATTEDREKDSFSKYYSKEVKRDKKSKPKAYQIKKTGKDHGRLQVSEGLLSVTNLLAKSRELGVSMSVLLTAVYLCAIRREMPRLQENRPVILMVPVNLRKFFPSQSMLNFFGWIEPGYQFDKSSQKEELMAVIAHVKQYFKDELTQEKMEDHMNGLVALEKHSILKFFPLELKNLGILTGAKKAEENVTAIFSNMGAVVMPEEYTPYISRFGVYTSTPKVELCMCSFGDKISLGFTSRFDSANIQRNFYQILSEIGVESEIVTPEYPQSDTPDLKSVRVFQWFSFLCIMAAVIVVGVNAVFTRGSYWSLLAVGGIASVWMALSMGYYKRHNLLKDAMWQLVLITCGCLIWDALIGWHGWSVDYVFPAASVGVMVSMGVITKIQSHTAREYMIYLLMAAVYSCLIPFILLMVGAVKVIYPSVISAGMGFLVVIGLMIFRWREFREELEKNFHV